MEKKLGIYSTNNGTESYDCYFNPEDKYAKAIGPMVVNGGHTARIVANVYAYTEEEAKIKLSQALGEGYFV